jgi:OmpA-OmpF porin, OOP family
MKMALAVSLTLGFSSVALAQNPLDLAKKAAGQASVSKVESEINRRLLEEGRKNQCSFKTNSDELMPGCDQKVKNLATVLIDAKKQLNTAGVTNYKFEVSGHTDSTGDAAANKMLSGKRAAVIAKELATSGVPQAEIISVGHGAEKLLVKPDDTAEKKAQNRRYEIQVRL